MAHLETVSGCRSTSTIGEWRAFSLVSIVIRRSWFELEFFILPSYLNHLYWLYRLLRPTGL